MGAEQDRQRTQKAGFDHHLTKPVDYSTLEPLLQTTSRDDQQRAGLSPRAPRHTQGAEHTMSNKKVVEPLWSLRMLAVLSIALPLVIYSALGTFRFIESKSGAEQRVSRSLRIANEHASKVLGGAEAVQDRVFDLVDRKSQRELEANLQRLHEALKARTAGQTQIQSIWVIGADGKPIATSLSYPAPEINLSERPYFRFHQAGSTGRYLSEPFTTRLTKDTVLDLSLRFNKPDGSFGGVVNVSLFTSYFERFYSDLVADEPGLAVNMFRENGPVYTRWPIIKNAPDRLSSASPILTRVIAGEVSGQLRGVSSFDKQDRLLGIHQDRQLSAVRRHRHEHDRVAVSLHAGDGCAACTRTAAVRRLVLAALLAFEPAEDRCSKSYVRRSPPASARRRHSCRPRNWRRWAG